MYKFAKKNDALKIGGKYDSATTLSRKCANNSGYVKRKFHGIYILIVYKLTNT